MNTVCRQRWAAVCLLSFLMTGFGASAQFLDADIIAAQNIDGEMRAKMGALIGPAVEKIAGGKPADVSAGRNTLITPLRDVSASIPFKAAYSALLEPRIKPLASDQSLLIRINAMIVLGRMTDDKSMALVMAGLKDGSIAVRRKAAEALRLRVQQYLLLPPGNAGAQKGIADAMNAIDQKMAQDPPPHPDVYAVCTRILMEIGTTEALLQLLGYLNDRVPLHAANPEMSFDAERSVIENLGGFVANSRPFPKDLATPLIRATHRYAHIATIQLAAGNLNEQQRADAKYAVQQCLQVLNAITGAAGKVAPGDQSQVSNWLPQNDWASIGKLLKEGWVPVLKADPFKLTDEQLELK